ARGSDTDLTSPRIVAVLRGTACRAAAPRGARRSLHRTPSDPHGTPPASRWRRRPIRRKRVESLCRCATPLRRFRRRLLALTIATRVVRPREGKKERDHGEEAVRRESVLSHNECGPGGAVCRGGDL